MPFDHDERETEHQGSRASLGKPLVHASRVLQIRSQYLNPGNYLPFGLIENGAMTLAHPGDPYLEKYGKFMETPIPRARNESKMGLLKTLSHTSEWQRYEAYKARQKRKEKKADP